MSVITDVGSYRQAVTLSNASAPIADGDGGYTQTQVALDPAEWRCAIERASVASAERDFAETIIAQATYVMRGRFHPGITTETRVQWTDRAGVVHIGNVIDSNDSEGAGVETVIAVTEITNAVPPVDTGWVQSGWIQ